MISRRRVHAEWNRPLRGAGTGKVILEDRFNDGHFAERWEDGTGGQMMETNEYLYLNYNNWQGGDFVLRDAFVPINNGYDILVTFDVYFQDTGSTDIILDLLDGAGTRRWIHATPYSTGVDFNGDAFSSYAPKLQWLPVTGIIRYGMQQLYYGQTLKYTCFAAPVSGLTKIAIILRNYASVRNLVIRQLD